jgi:hypothetical protein
VIDDSLVGIEVSVEFSDVPQALPINASVAIATIER